MIETNRLILRPFEWSDLEALHEILSDEASMKHYPKPFDLKKCKAWIERNLNRYKTDGFGMWAVILKSENKFIGDCGITMQNINGEMQPEIGYHINKHYTRKGYATEAAIACKQYAFDVLKLDAVYSYMKHTNMPSSKVAENNGMKLVCSYDDPVNVITKVYKITREAYLSQS